MRRASAATWPASRQRWSIATAFVASTTALACEINTLASPKAALLTFVLGVVAYNAVALRKLPCAVRMAEQ